jgi:hypothetical protein
MSSAYDIHYATFPDDDPHADWREHCRQELTRQLNIRMDEIWDETLSRLTDGSNAAGHPIRERLLDLLDRPLEDFSDLAGWQRYLPVRTKLELADAFLSALGRAQLCVARRVMDVQD